MNAPFHIRDRVRLCGLRDAAADLAASNARFDRMLAQQDAHRAAVASTFDRIRDAANARRWAAEEASA